MDCVYVFVSRWFLLRPVVGAEGMIMYETRINDETGAHNVYLIRYSMDRQPAVH
jgi:hypothetical protein